MTLGLERDFKNFWLIKALFKSDQKAQDWLEKKPSDRRIQFLETDF